MNLKSVTICLFLFFTNIFNSLAQFNQITVENSSKPDIKIVQIDFRGLSTLIHFEFTNSNQEWICSSENVYIQDKSSYKKYNLLNSINLPFCPNVHVLSGPDQKHFFTLEFEKVPENIGLFDIIEVNDRRETGWYFKNCKIETGYHGSFIDVESFTESTPVKEYGYYYDDGRQTYYYKFNGTVICTSVSIERNYGKYYQVNILIQNLFGRDRTFNPDLIYAKLRKNGEIFSSAPLPYNKYMKKVNNRQAWAAAALALSEGLAAANAGYSNTYSSGSSSGYSSTYGSASGYVGNNYGSIYGSSNTYSSTYGTSYSRSYDGAAAYAAQQNAIRNVANYTNKQFQINKQINQGYAKIHTIKNETEYLGYVNIEYTNADEMKLIIPFNNTDYTFTYTFNSESNYSFNSKSNIVKNDVPSTENSNSNKDVGFIYENNEPGIYYKENSCLIYKEISTTEVVIKCLNETGRAYENYTIKKSELDFVGITYEWQITSEQSIKEDDLIFEYLEPGIYYNGINCMVNEELSVTEVKIKCLNETGRAYDKYTIKKSELVFHETTHEWQITENFSDEDKNIPNDNNISKVVVPGFYLNGVFCKIIKELPNGYVKIKYLNETGRAYYKKVVLRSELVEVK